MKYLLLFTTMLFAAEMEVDGNLKVTGTVDANGNPITNVGTALSMTDAINGNVLQSALRDDGVYEYTIFTFLGTGGSNYQTMYRKYDQNTASNYFDMTEYMNTLSQEGWTFFVLLQNTTMIWKRPISEE